MQKRVYSGHQCSFLPWVGFWNKVYHADVFDVSIFNQFTSKTWQHYSFIANADKKAKWGLKIQKSFNHQSYNFSINQIKVEKNFSQRLLREFEQAHYADKHFNDVFPLLISWLESVEHLDSLWLINFVLLNLVKNFLCIETPFVISAPNTTDNATLNIIENVKRNGANHYLSGPHGTDYLDEALFKENNIDLTFQDSRYMYQKYPLSIPATISLFGIGRTLEIIKNGT